MPNDNLGTATGRIRLEVEDRASAKLLLTLNKLSRQFDDMNKKLGRIEKTLKSSDDTFEKTSKSIDRTTKATKGFTTGIFAANKSVKRFSTDIADLYDTFNRLSVVLERANRWYQPLKKTYTVLDSMSRLKLDPQIRTLDRFGKSLNSVGINARTSAKAFGSWYFDLKSDMSAMPTWIQNLNRLSIKVAQVGTAGLLLSKLAKGNPFERLLNTKLFQRIAMQSEGAGMAIEKFAKRADHNFNFLSRAFNNGFKPIADFAKSAKGFVAGVAMVRSGVDGILSKFRFLQRIPRPILQGLALMISQTLPVALSILGKALTGTSNLLLGLLNGVKQLSGGFLVLPGLFASIGVIASSLMPVFKGLKDSFKDIFSADPAKAMAAYINLPEHLRPLADVLKGLAPRWKDFTKALQTEAFAKVEGQIQKIADVYLPLWEKGAKKVIVSIRGLKDEFVGFIAQQNTQKDISIMYQRVAEAIGNIKPAIQPALEGLRDLATVGTGFIRDMTSMIPGMAKGFADWAKTNRGNGNLLRWMQDSRRGVYDLIKGVSSLTKGLWSMLTIFRSNQGTNFLDRFATSMEKFNQTVQKSASVGKLRSMRNAVRDMLDPGSNPGGSKMEDMKGTLKDFRDMLSSVWKVVAHTSQAFSEEFLPALRTVMNFINVMAQLKSALGLDQFVGKILGFVAAWKLLNHVSTSVINVFKVLGGSILTLKNSAKVISLVDTGFIKLISVLDHLGPVGQRASMSLSNVRTSLTGVIGTLARIALPVAGVLAAVGGAWYAWEKRNDAVKDGLENITDAAQHTKQAGIDIKNAFIDDGGLSGKTVMDTVGQSIDQMFNDLKTASDSAPGIMDHLGDMLAGGPRSGENNRAHGIFRGETEEFNKVQKAAEDATKAQENFNRAGVTQKDLKEAVTGSAESFETLRNRLIAAGDGADQSTKAIQDLRDEYQRAQRAAAELGDSGVIVAAGLKKMADAGGDATSKLEGLKQVLEGLGIIKTTALEAAAAYSKEIRDLAANVQEAIAGGAGFTDLIDQQTGTFNINTEAGTKLFEVFKGLGDAFLATAVKNKNAGQAYADFEGQLGDLITKTGLSREVLLGLAHDVGVVPKEVDFILKLQDSPDMMQRDIGAALLQAQQQLLTTGGVRVPINVEGNPQEVADRINRIMQRAVASVSAAGNLVLDPSFNQDSLNDLYRNLAEHGFGSPGFPAKPIPVGIATTSGVITVDNGGKDPVINTQDLDKAEEELRKVVEQAQANGEDVRSAGQKFVDEYAKGIQANPAAKEALKRMLEDMMNNLHRSPPKKGPLSEHGDAAKYGGQQFGKSYATGIASQEAQVGSAATSVVGAAGASLKGDKNYQSGEFLGQLTQMTDFAQHFVDVFDKLAQTVLSFVKFASDPLGKGTFFGSSAKFKRDPAVSDKALATQNADAAQGRMFGFYGSGQRPDVDPQTLMQRLPQGQLQRDASKADIQAQIAAVGAAHGATPEDIAAAYAIVDQETGGSYNPVILGKGMGGGGADAYGLFQQTEGMWGTKDELTNPNIAIQKYWDAWAKGSGQGAARAVATQNPGGYGADDITKRMAGGTLKEVTDILKNVGTGGPVTNLGYIPGMPANVLPGTMPSKLRPGEGTDAGLKPNAAVAASILSAMFPGITDIGGRQNRTGPQMHPNGRALDVMTGQNAALGDQIFAWAQANAGNLGIQSAIWRDIGHNFVQNEGGGPGTTYSAEGHGGASGTDSGSHVHIQFSDSTTVDVSPNGTASVNVPFNSPYATQSQGYGLPPEPDKPGDAPRDLVTIGPNGEKIPVSGDHLGNNPVEINAATGLPWTPQESVDFWNRPENAKRYDRSQLNPGDDSVPGIFQGTQEQLLDEVKNQSPLLQGILDGTNQQLTETEAINAANQLQVEIDKQTALDTPASRARASALQGVQSGITSQYGLTQDNPIDQASGIVGQISGVAGDIFKVINSTIEAIGATKDIADTLIRYPSNTEDIFRMIDDFQKYITLAADIAGATSSVLGAIGGLSGGEASMGASSAIQGASQIAAMVQAALETVNAMIDLGQEAYRLIGTYVGDFLGYLVGGQDSLRGNIKFLLDTQTNQLLTYSQDNPLDKRTHDGVGGANAARSQLARDIYVYGGPGQDPRDNTRQMMMQIKMSQSSVPTGQ